MPASSQSFPHAPRAPGLPDRRLIHTPPPPRGRRRHSRLHLLLARPTLALAMLLPGGCASIGGAAAHHPPVAEINVGHAGKVALRGYDPVAYFRVGRPVAGSDAHSLVWKNTKWKFATEADRRAFRAAPDRYAPQYGGYCAFALSQGLLADADPHLWAIARDRLYVNNNAVVHALWKLNRTADITSGDQHWQAWPKGTLPR